MRFWPNGNLFPVQTTRFERLQPVLILLSVAVGLALAPFDHWPPDWTARPGSGLPSPTLDSPSGALATHCATLTAAARWGRAGQTYCDRSASAATPHQNLETSA